MSFSFLTFYRMSWCMVLPCKYLCLKRLPRTKYCTACGPARTAYSLTTQGMPICRTAPSAALELLNAKLVSIMNAIDNIRCLLMQSSLDSCRVTCRSSAVTEMLNAHRLLLLQVTLQLFTLPFIRHLLSRCAFAACCATTLSCKHWLEGICQTPCLHM